MTQMTQTQYQAKLAEFDEKVAYLEKQLADVKYEKMRWNFEIAKGTVMAEQEAIRQQEIAKQAEEALKTKGGKSEEKSE